VRLDRAAERRWRRGDARWRKSLRHDQLLRGERGGSGRGAGFFVGGGLVAVVPAIVNTTLCSVKYSAMRASRKSLIEIGGFRFPQYSRSWL
jgi:hypothetical protein